MPDPSDFEAAAASFRRQPGTRCSICVWLASLDHIRPEEAPGVRRAMSNLAIPVSGIIAAAAQRGLPPFPVDDPDQAIKRHRAKGHDGRVAA